MVANLLAVALVVFVLREKKEDQRVNSTDSIESSDLNEMDTVIFSYVADVVSRFPGLQHSDGVLLDVVSLSLVSIPILSVQFL